MTVFPGPAVLGRGVVVLEGGELPECCLAWPRVVIDAAALADPGPAADELHRRWLARDRVVVVLAVDPARLREREVSTLAPWRLGTGAEFGRERLQYLTWSNNYDLRSGEPVWWHARRAEHLGAHRGGPADVLLDDGTPAYCDGGPRGPITVPGSAIVHRFTLEAGRLTPERDTPSSAALAHDQRRAVTHGAGGARIIAPAGSGKTRVLTERLRHLLEGRGVAPGSVVALAYNTRAARELSERTVGLGAHIRTFNSLGLAVLNGTRPFEPTGRPARRVIDEREVRRILETLVHVRRQQNADPLAPYLEALSAIRLGLRDPREVEEVIPDASGIAAIFEDYRAVLAQRCVVDFDEQIYGAIELLLGDPVVRACDQRIARHVLVDEFQDLTPAHLVLLRLLSAPTYDVFGVGDDDQVIYGYAGGSPEFLIDYGRYFPGAASYALEVNYRCPRAVTEAARHLLSYNGRRLEKALEPGPDVPTRPDALVVDRRPSARHGAAVAEWIASWAAAGASYDDMAVLTRVNSALLAAQVTLREAGVPSSAPLDVSVLSRTGIRAALAYLRIGLDPDHIARGDIVETARRPSRRIARNVLEMLGRRSTTSIASVRSLARALTGDDVDRLSAYADDLEQAARAVATGSTAAALEVIRVGIGLGRAMDVLDSSRGGADRSTHADDLAALEQVAMLHDDPATFESWLVRSLERAPAANGVTLSTVHRVKGQEWPLVIVLDADDGAFPHRLSDDAEEERRIFHVAITRASEQLVLLADDLTPSPFCDELTGVRPHGVAGTASGPSTTARPRVHAPQTSSQPHDTLVASVGMRVRARGGIDAEIVSLTEQGVVVTVPGGRARINLPYSSEVVVDGRTVRLVRASGAVRNDVVAVLRAWRLETAARAKVPAYVVFSDDHLRGIASAMPRPTEELSHCRGVGPLKLDRYGDEILALLESLADRDPAPQ